MTRWMADIIFLDDKGSHLDVIERTLECILGMGENVECIFHMYAHMLVCLALTLWTSKLKREECLGKKKRKKEKFVKGNCWIVNFTRN